MIELSARGKPRHELVMAAWKECDTAKLRKMLGGDMCNTYGACSSSNACHKCCLNTIRDKELSMSRYVGEEEQRRSKCQDCENPCGAILRLEEVL